MKDMRERESAANKEIRTLKEKEVSMQRDLNYLRAEKEALQGRVGLLAPEAADLKAHLASVRAAIYDAKDKNDALLAENKKLAEENANLTQRVQTLLQERAPKEEKKAEYEPYQPRYSQQRFPTPAHSSSPKLAIDTKRLAADLEYHKYDQLQIIV